MKPAFYALALAPTAALAHAGPHSASDGFGHILSNADHLAVLAVALAVVGTIYWRRRRGRAAPRRDDRQ